MCEKLSRLVSQAVGNRRSIAAPSRVDPGRAASKQASPVSALLGMALILAAAVSYAAVDLLTTWTSARWLVLPVAAAVLAGAALLYSRSLAGLDRFALRRREPPYLPVRASRADLPLAVCAAIARPQARRTNIYRSSSTWRPSVTGSRPSS